MTDSDDSGDDTGPNLKVCTDDSFAVAVEAGSFVDKTLLIYALFRVDDTPKVMITAPRRFGKSLNLDMLRLFLELETNSEGKEKAEQQKENRKLFEQKKLNIMKKSKIVKKHMGKYPVIFVSLYTSASVPSKEAALTACRMAIHLVYKMHSYLYKHDTGKKLEDDEKAKCKKWCGDPDYKKFECDDVVPALKELSEYLCKFHGRKVFVLIDEYDCIISSAMFEIKDKEARNEALHLPIAILGAVLKGNRTNISGAVVTGILYMKGTKISSTMGNVERYRFGSSDLNMDFNGFFQNEVDALFDKWKVNVKLKGPAIEFYNKYYNLKGKALYNPYAIVRFLKATKGKAELTPGNLVHYWEESGYVVGMKKMFRDPGVLKIICKLLEKEEVFCVVSDDLILDNLNMLADGLPVADNGVTVVLLFLCQGYLTLSPGGNTGRDEKTRSVRITNLAAECELKKLVISYVHEDCQLNMTLTKACANSFSKLPSLCEMQDLEYLKDELQTLQKNLDDLLRTAKLVEPVNEPTIYSILLVISLQAGVYFGQQAEPVVGRRHQLDVISFLGNFGAVTEVKLEESTSKKAMLQVFGNRYYKIFASNKYYFAGKHPQLSLIMGLHLNTAKHFSICFIRKQELREAVNEAGESCEGLEEGINLALGDWYEKDNGENKWYEKHMDDDAIQRFLTKCTELA